MGYRLKCSEIAALATRFAAERADLNLSREELDGLVVLSIKDVSEDELEGVCREEGLSREMPVIYSAFLDFLQSPEASEPISEALPEPSPEPSPKPIGTGRPEPTEAPAESLRFMTIPVTRQSMEADAAFHIGLKRFLEAFCDWQKTRDDPTFTQILRTLCGDIPDREWNELLKTIALVYESHTKPQRPAIPPELSSFRAELERLSLRFDKLEKGFAKCQSSE